MPSKILDEIMGISYKIILIIFKDQIKKTSLKKNIIKNKRKWTDKYVMSLNNYSLAKWQKNLF